MSMSDSPMQRFDDCMQRARERNVPLPEGVALATADAPGRPSVRMVMLRGHDERGFVFYTNRDSRKGRELATRAQAALCFWWPQLEEQVRVEGRVVELPAAEADAYFASRPRGSQIGAWASRQSEELGSRAALEEAVASTEKRFAGIDVPRPPFWQGYLLIPDSVEFWRGRADRLHERDVFIRDGDVWRHKMLQP